jgi:L-aspartate oxidase
MELKTDVLIIGSGIAGLFSAIKISEFADVILITKKDKTESNTNYAQGGIASVLDKSDSFESHITDTINAGAGLCDHKMVEIMIYEGPERIKELITIGTRFTKKGKYLHLAKEAGHSTSRIVHSKDLTGREVERSLINRTMSINNISIIENALAIDLITEHNSQSQRLLPIDNRHCWGAYVLDNFSKQVMKIRSKVTILATGGLGQIYSNTTNPDIATGDGFAMGYRAGAKIANMEFVQFHPTSFYIGDNSINKKQSFLISEAVRGFGGILRTADGFAFMKKYDNRLELAPRDIVARAIDSEMKIRGDDLVYLDITNKRKKDIIQMFPNIYKNCLKFNVNISKDWIPVVPAAHYSCGGVIIDEFGKTSLEGLYATGEVSMTGVHGANRLASNSLLEALVFSHRASEDIKVYLQRYSDCKTDILEWDDKNTLSPDEEVLISHNKKELKQLMTDYVGIVRSNNRLNFAERRIENLFFEVEEFYKKTKVYTDLIELRNMVTCAYLVVKSAKLRKESRGLHFNMDYPDPNNKSIPENTILQNIYQKS